MQNHDDFDHRRLSQWVVSLAVTIVCCAIFFLLSASHFLDVQRQLVIVQVRSEMLEARLNTLESSMFLRNNMARPAQQHTPAPVPGTEPAAPIVPDAIPLSAPPPAQKEKSGATVAPLLDTQTSAPSDSKAATPDQAVPAPQEQKTAPEPAAE